MKTGRLAALASLALFGLAVIPLLAHADDGTSIYGVSDFGLMSDPGVTPAGSTVRIGGGRTDSPMLARRGVPYFSAVAAFDTFDTLGAGEATRFMVGNDYRANNVARYSLSTLGGWHADLGYGLGATPGNIATVRQVGFGAGYTLGAWDIKLGHHRVEDASGTVLARNTLIGGAYDFGPIKTWLAYAVNKDDATLDTRDLLIGVTAPFGASTIAADYIRKTDKFNNNVSASQSVVAYYYYLSPRTNMYALYSRLANDGAANYGVVIPGTTDRILTVGIRHSF